MRRHFPTFDSAVLALVLGSLRAAGNELPPDAAPRIREVLGVDRFTLADLALPERDGGQGELPEELTLTPTIDGEPRLLILRQESMRAPGFRLLVQGSDGGFREALTPPARTYRGTLAGDPEKVIAGSLLPEGLHARVSDPGGSSFTIRPLREFVETAPRALHVVVDGEDEPPFLCGTPSDERGGGSGAGSPRRDMETVLPGDDAGSGGGAPCTLKEAEIAFDSDFEFFDRTGGGSPDTCLDIVEMGLNISNAIYARDVGITHRLTRLVVRSDPAADFWKRFPDASNFGAMLDAFRNEWNANMRQVPRDIAYYLTGKSNPNLGGLAYVGVVCSNFHYGMGIGNRGFDGIFRHEVGHNWGAGHSCGTERRFIMCGESIQAHSAYNIRIIADHRDSRSCLVDVPNESAPEPPYVRLDRFIRFVDDGPIAIDPAAEDTDINCIPPRLVAHDEHSAFGAAILPLGPLTPGGPDALLYVPRSDLHGTDYFGYTVMDGEGHERTGAVLVESRPRELIVHLELDETTGTDAADSSGSDHEGELRGALRFDTDSTAGHHGQALKLSGISGEYLSLGNDSDFDLPKELTAALWFRFDSPRAAGGESLIGKGDDAWRLGRDGALPGLRFTLTGVRVGTDSAGNLRGSTPVTDGAWHHVVAVYEGGRAALYIDGELDEERPASGRINKNSSSLRIGDDLLNGVVDEVRVYNFGLDGEAARALFLDSRLERADPPEGKSGVVPGAKLAWLEAPSATAYDVYLGSDEGAVAAADRASPEYRGRVTSNLFSPVLELDLGYAWRVDPVVGGAARRGEVHRFSTGFAYTDFAEPSLNARSYTPGPTARELGFQTTSTPTGGDAPFTGVIDTGSTSTSPIFSHRSVSAETRIGPVDLADRSGAAVSLILQARDTGYEEAQDRVELRATDGTESVTLVSLDGGNPLTQRAGTGYQTYGAVLPASWRQASLVIASSSNSSEGSERYDFDQVGFFCRRPVDIIAHSHFEEAPARASSYTPPPGSEELGFRTQSTPLGSGPFTGIEEEGAVLRSRLLAHRSVRATTTFDAVDLRGSEAVEVTVTVRVRETAYEADDLLEILAANGAEQVILVRLDGNTGLDEIAGDYTSFRAQIPAGWGTATLLVSSSTNSSAGAEGIDIRLVELTSHARLDDCGQAPPLLLFRRGDGNADGVLDLSDGIRILDYLFRGGVDIECHDAGDTDDGGSIDLADTIRIFNYLFVGGEPPSPPGSDQCGTDPTDDLLECSTQPECP